ncbi:MAG: DUF1587 domain-containing protein, partial [Planctomycetota bacterium]
MLNSHCVECHGDDDTNAGIDLTPFADEIDIWKRRRVWTKVLAVLEQGSMPPDYGTPLDAEDRSQLTSWVGHTLDNIDLSRVPEDPGAVPPRRLTRSEYAYTVQDLFGVDVEQVLELPREQTIGEAFDNNAATLTVEPLWFEKALATADAVVKAVWNDPAALDRLLFIRPSPALKPDKAAYVASPADTSLCDMGGDFTVLANIKGFEGPIFLRAPRGGEFTRGSKRLSFDDENIAYTIQRGRTLRAAGV